MNKKRFLWLFVGVVILVAALVSGFIYFQPTAEDILVDMLESMETVNDAHVILEVSVDSVEKDGSATVEIWGRKGEDRPGAFRIEVLTASEDKAEGAVVVSDGETIYAYSPSEAKVLIGTVEEAKKWIEEQEFEHGELVKNRHEQTVGEHPENAEQAVDRLLEKFSAELIGVEQAATGATDYLKLDPIPEQMPSEYIAVGGFINLWIDKASSLPAAVEYTGGSMGSGRAAVLELKVNEGLDESLFSFDIPPEVEVLGFEDFKPNSLSLEEAAAAAEFVLLTPTEVPEGSTLVDLLEVRGAIIQRFALPDGSSFTIAQGITDEKPQPPTESQAVEVRGVGGTAYVSEGGDQLLLTWIEGELSYYIAGDLSLDQALMIAESMQ